MYCRVCGNHMSDNVVSCNKCGTKKGNGTKFCQMCGYRTAERAEFCLYCGIRIKNITTQQIKTKYLPNLHKQIKTKKKIMQALKLIFLLSIGLTILFIIILVIRPEPDNIPELSNLPYPPNVLNDYMEYGNYEVQKYWQQGRNLIGYEISAFFVSISTGISFLINKKQYKKLLKKIKEDK